MLLKDSSSSLPLSRAGSMASTSCSVKSSRAWISYTLSVHYPTPFQCPYANDRLQRMFRRVVRTSLSRMLSSPRAANWNSKSRWTRKGTRCLSTPSYKRLACFLPCKSWQRTNENAFFSRRLTLPRLRRLLLNPSSPPRTPPLLPRRSLRSPLRARPPRLRSTRSCALRAARR